MIIESYYVPGTLLRVEGKAAKKTYTVLSWLGENDSKESFPEDEEAFLQQTVELSLQV